MKNTIISFNVKVTLVTKPWSLKILLLRAGFGMWKHTASVAQLFEELAHCEVLKMWNLWHE